MLPDFDGSFGLLHKIILRLKVSMEDKTLEQCLLSLRNLCSKSATRAEIPAKHSNQDHSIENGDHVLEIFCTNSVVLEMKKGCMALRTVD